jgi:hypothetical protein
MANAVTVSWTVETEVEKTDTGYVCDWRLIIYAGQIEIDDIKGRIEVGFSLDPITQGMTEVSDGS